MCLNLSLYIDIYIHTSKYVVINPYRFHAGQVVYYEGHPGDYFYIIENGHVNVWVNYAAFKHTRKEEDENRVPRIKTRTREKQP